MSAATALQFRSPLRPGLAPFLWMVLAIFMVVLTSVVGLQAAGQDRLAASALAIVGPLLGFIGALLVWFVQARLERQERQSRALEALKSEVAVSLVEYCQAFAPANSAHLQDTFRRGFADHPGEYFPIFGETTDSRIFSALGSDFLIVPERVLFWLICFERADRTFGAYVRTAQPDKLSSTPDPVKQRLVDRIIAQGELGLLLATLSLIALRDYQNDLNVAAHERKRPSDPDRSEGLSTFETLVRRLSSRANPVEQLPISMMDLATLAKRHRRYIRQLAQQAFIRPAEWVPS